MSKVLIKYEDIYGGCCGCSSYDNLAICDAEDAADCLKSVLEQHPYLDGKFIRVESLPTYDPELKILTSK